ncbi:nucleoside-diphosphate kinase [Lentisphaera profundi]|uniref:nucleoside-diphosphate kinase n=1 Tax=Lentisphaera profundi TaxID=1658616 RepID=A0ABY7VTB3_9BACT|nr:nucleoside-diphosphate kinase [Lentisphaera profundi]WDE96460.1 nucleoside-diphosphate kinase [Lentisphaera profundi]
MYEKSLIIIKPDGVQRGLVGNIITRFENVGLKIHGMKFVQPTQEMARTHYSEHVDKAFYPTVEEYILSGPVLVFALGGMNAVKKIRLMVGATEPASSAPGTIRGDLAHQSYPDPGEPDDKPIRNLIHASGSSEEAVTEVKLWFTDDEIIEYGKITDELLAL